MNCRFFAGSLAVAAGLFLAIFAEAAELRRDLEVANGKRNGGDETFTVTEGDAVTLEIASDRAIELHLHGYDLEIALAAGERREIALPSHLTGRFPIELHKLEGRPADAVLLYYQVYPK